MNGNNLESSKAVCVAVCPDQQLDFQESVQAFSMRTGYGLCDYDIPVDDYTTGGWRDESCPSLPVPARWFLINQVLSELINSKSYFYVHVEVHTQPVADTQTFPTAAYTMHIYVCVFVIEHCILVPL